MLDHLLKEAVAQMRLVEQGARLLVEQGRAQAGEDEVAGVAAERALVRVVAVVDEPEQDLEGLLDMPAALAVRGLEVDEGDVAKASDAVAGLVVRVVDREDAELGAGLGEQQHDDPIEVPQALTREVFRIERPPGALLPLADVLDDDVRQDFDATTYAVA